MASSISSDGDDFRPAALVALSMTPTAEPPPIGTWAGIAKVMGVPHSAVASTATHTLLSADGARRSTRVRAPTDKHIIFLAAGVRKHSSYEETGVSASIAAGHLRRTHPRDSCLALMVMGLEVEP